MMKFVLNNIVILILILVSCNKNEELTEGKQALNYNFSISVKVRNNYHEQQNTKSKLFFRWVNLELREYLKNEAGCKNITAGESPISKDYYYLPNYKGHGGLYNLFNEGTLGKMLVYVPDSLDGWYCESNDEDFIFYFNNWNLWPEHAGRIFLLYKIELGMLESELKLKLNKPCQEYRNYLVYHDYYNTIAVFEIKNKKIESILIGKYKIIWEKPNEISEDFLNQILNP
ncbi:MAG: hypothetical protein JXL97_06355 [Bacteroidales bacterium]|nr:hypothetical protein [Bacteroidales bacterium]